LESNKYLTYLSFTLEAFHHHHHDPSKYLEPGDVRWLVIQFPLSLFAIKSRKSFLPSFLLPKTKEQRERVQRLIEKGKSCPREYRSGLLALRKER
jgi:hypothetical protein